MVKSLSLVIPIYNEEENINQLINDLKGFFSDFREDFEILFVDDGSSDDSTNVICQKKTENMRLIEHSVNKGYGEALKTGFKESSMNIIGYIDGDGQYNVKDIDKLLKLIKQHDLVIGSRLDRQDSFDRILISRFFNYIARKSLGIKFDDIDCGLKFFRKEVFEEIELSTRRTVDAELLAKASQKGFSIAQIDVMHYERNGGDSEAEGLIGVRTKLILITLLEIIQIKGDLR